MKKKLVTILCVVCIVMVFSACGNSTTPTSESAATESSQDKTTAEPSSTEPYSTTETASSETDSTSLPETSITSETAAPANNTDLGDSLGDPIKVSLDGVVYMFPGSTFADFEANGWVIDSGSEGASLGANYSTSVEYTKGDSTIKLSAANEGDSAMPINECVCWALVCQIDETIDIEFPGGITRGSTPEEVEAAYGEPTSSYDNSEGVRTSMEYKLDNCSVKFQFLGDEGGLSNIDIRS